MADYPQYISSPNLRIRGVADDPNRQTRQYSASRKKKKKTGLKANAEAIISTFLNPSFMPFGGAADVATMLPGYTKENISDSGGPGLLSNMARVYNTLTGGAGAVPGGALSNAATGITGQGDLTGTDPWTGFAGNYAAGGTDLLWSNPEIMIRDKMKELGFGKNDGLMDLMEQYASVMPYLQMLGLGGGDPNSMTPESVINWSGDWVDQMLTPGAGGGDVWGMIQQVLDAPAGSALAASLESGTPEQQAANLNNLIRAATVNMPPLFQQALADVLEDKTTDWLSQKARGKEGYRGFLADWLQKGGKGILG